MPDDFFADIPDAAPPRPVRVGRRPRTKSPSVRLDGVDPELVSFAADEDAVVTSGRDSAGVHHPHSLHGSGAALDLRTRDRTPEQVRQMQERAQTRGLHAAFERGGVGGATGDHLHVSRGTQQPPARPQTAPAENFFDDVPDAPPEDFFADIPDAPPDVSRATPQVTSQPQAPSQAPVPVPPPSVATGRPELPPVSLAPPGARESAPQAPTLPPVSSSTSTTPQPATLEGVSEPEGATPAAPSVNLPAPDLVQRKVQTPGAASQPPAPPPAPPSTTPPATAPAPVSPPVPARMEGPEALPPAQGGEPEERPVMENGAIRVAAPPDATAESLIYRAFYDLAKSQKLPDPLADQYARQVAADGMADGEQFAARSRAAGGAAVGVKPENLELLRHYAEGAQSGANIEAQMTAATGVMQASTDEQRRHEQELRRQAEAEVAREMPPTPQMTPEGVPSPDPSRELAERETRTREVESRVNQRLAMERVHGELSQLVIDRPRLVKEMRAAVESRMEDYASGRVGGKFGQEYGSGMLGAEALGAGTLPGARMSALDRMAEREADALIQDIEYAKRSTDPNAAVGVVESVYQRFRKNPFVLVPVLSTLTDLDSTLKASDASARATQALNAGREPEQRDKLILAAHQAAEHVNQTAYADIANLVVEQPAFWGEFALMGPTTGAIEETVGRGLARVGIRGLEEGAEIGAGAFRSRLGARVLGEEALSGTSRSLAERSAYKVGELISKTVQTTVAGGAMTGTVGIPRIGQEYVERRMKGEDGPTAFVHSVLNQAGEYVSEFQGDVLELMPGMKRLNDLLRPVMKNFEAYGYHGIAGEIYEEAWKDFIWDPATALSSAERKQRFAEAVERWSNPRTWGVMAVGFGLPGVGGAMYGHASKALGQMRQEFGGKLEDLSAHIAELQQQPASEETAEALAQAEEERRHYTGLVEQIDTHEQEVTRQEAEVAAAEQRQAATVESSEAGAPVRDEEVPAAQGGQASAAAEQPADAPVPTESHERDKVTGVTQGEEAASPARSEAEDFADEIMREMGGGEAEAAGQVDEHGFREFPAERQSLGVPRAQMPQVKAEHRGALVNYLEARGVEHEEMMVRPSSLKPTQAEYSPEKVEKAREYEGGNRAILVSGDGYVLDGQHQLEQAREDAPETPYRVIVLHGDARDLLPLIHDFPSSTVNKESEGGPKEAPTTAESFAEEMTSDYPTAVVDQILSPEHPGNIQPAEGVLAPAASEDEEALYRRAVEATRDTGRLSTSNLQRELKIGYGPASRLVQRMRDDGTAARYGIVDAHVGQSEATPPAPGHGQSSNMATPATQAIGVAPAVGRRFKFPSGKEGVVRREYVAPQSGTPMYEVEVGGKTLDVPRARVQFEDTKNRPHEEGKQQGTQAEEPESDFRRRVREAKERQRKKTFRSFGPDDLGDWSLIVAGEIADGARSLKDLLRKLREDWPEQWADIKGHAERLWESARLSLDLEGERTDDLAEFSTSEFNEAIKGIERHADRPEDGGARDAGVVRKDSEAEAGEDHEETKEEEDLYVAPDPLEAQDADPPRVALGRKFATEFIKGRTFSTITQARKFAAEKIGAAVDAGTVAAKDVDEAVEVGVGIAARQFVQQRRAAGAGDVEIYYRLVQLYEGQQPNLSVRTSTSAIEQAYSTPAPLAFVASRLAGINRRTSVLGNTAGNGMLLIEAAPETLVLNEKNSARFATLEALFPLADVRQGDALSLKLDRPVDRYIENPPFGVVKDDSGQSKKFEAFGRSTTQIDHAIAAAGLSNLADNGRAVLIVGGIKARTTEERKKGYDAKRLFYFDLYGAYNVVDHFTVSGDLYERQGAGWPVDVIVIDGRGKSSRRLPAADPPRVYKTWDDLAEVLTNEYVEPEISGVDAGDRPTGAGGATRGGGADTRGAGVAGHGDVSDVSGRPGTDDVGAGARPETGASRVGVSPGVGGDAGSHAADGQSERGRAGGRAGEPGASDETVVDGSTGQQTAEEDSRRQPGGEKTRRGDESVGVDEYGSRPAAQRAQVDISKSQVSYAPASRGRGMKTLTPVNMATAAQDALDALIKRLGGVRGDDTLDHFVAGRLGWTLEELRGTEENQGRLGAEQVDAVALAVDNIEHGAAMILGDQPGIGKGRPVATVLEYASRLGKTPIFVTEKPGLYKDIVRDLVDIGVGSLEELRDAILMTNASEEVTLNEDLENPVKLRTPDTKTHNAALAAVAASGSLPEGKRYIFTTYSQMQQIKGETARQRFLRDMASGAVIVFDESHNAGGTENAGWGKKGSEGAPQHDPLSRAGFAREVIDLAHGVFYSSGTFAKRASVMDLYSKTDMRLSVSNVPLAEMIAKGGVPLQQIVSSMLVESGQMLRRERSFEGIEYATAVAPVNQESAETVASVMQTVFQFDKIKKEALSGIKESIRENAEAIGVDPATGAASASSTAFSSLIHNLVDQMLLSLKVGPAVEHVLESLRAGEKPVVTVAFTFGSFLESYAKEFQVQPGEAVGLNFGDMLKRYLDRTRDVTYKRPDGTTYRKRLTDEQLGPRGVALYGEAQRQIQEADWSQMPVSPLDYIKYRIESEIDPKTGRNYKVGEITGRTYALDYSEHFRTKGEAPPVFRRRAQGEKNTKGRISQIVGFNEGSLDAMLLNQAGNSGLSLHASERVSDRRPRHMIVAQPERNIDTHMQLLFRINRTGQVVLPRYTQLVADIPSEKRPAAVLAKKMASLNANTTAARGSKFKSESVVDFMNVYGDQVALQLMENNPDLHERLGEPLATAEGMSGEDAARKVTGRLPILTLAEAAAIYDELEQEYNDLIERVNALGENALEAQTLALDAKTVKTVPVFEGTGERPFERGAVAEDVDVKRLRKPYSSAQVLDLVAQTLIKRFAELKAVEEVPEVENTTEGLRRLAQAGDWFRGYQREALDEEAKGYLAKELEAVVAVPRKDESQKEADSRAGQRRRMTETRVREVLRRWNEVHERYHVGQTVQVVSGSLGDMYGVITDIHRTGRTANPAALGAWKLTIALADAARSVNIPFSKIAVWRDIAESKDALEALNAYNVAEADEASVFDYSTLKRVTVPVLEAFERGQSVSRERRIIITGNLLAGFGRFEKARGQIINFTDDSGNLRQGILMPKDFDVEKALEDEPIIFKDASQVYKFLTTTPGLVTTPDGHFKIAMQGSNVKFTAPRAKGAGQKYWGNAAVLDAAGQDFVTKGDVMVLTTSDRVGVRVIEAALLQGWTLQTNTHKERAREITGTKQKGGASAAGGYASPRGAESDRASSRGGGRSLTDLPDVVGGAATDFSLSERARAILNRLGVPVHEKTISSRLLGIFKLRTQAVRVHALPDVFTVAHEGMHAISVSEGIGERVIAQTTRNHHLRQDLTRLYTEFYPKAKPSHALKTRVEEGLATLLQEYLYDPLYIQQHYPRLVNAFIKQGGLYNSAKTNQLLKEMGELIGDYVRMTPEQQFGARIARGDEIVRADSGFAPQERYVYEVHNDVEPLRRMGLLGQVSETRFDPDVAWVQWKGRSAIFSEWLRGDLGLVIPKLDGEYDVVKGVSVQHYLDIVGAENQKEWDWFLAARRVVADHNRIAELRAEAADPLTDPERAAEAVEEAEDLARVLAADKLPGLPKAVAVVTKYADRFKSAAPIYDKVSKAVVELSYQTGLITREYRDKLHASKGYAPFFKLINDEMRSGRPEVYGSPSKPAVKGRAFRRRSGGEEMIISPTFNQMTSIAEQLSKGMENIIWRRVLDLADDNPEIARRFEPVSAQEAGADEHGRVTKADIVKVMVDGKPEYRKVAPELLAVAQALHPQQLGWFGKLFVSSARLFQMLTTGVNPFFGMFKNLFIDQPTAALNTRTGYVPYKDALKTLPAYLSLVTGAHEAGIGGVDPAVVERLEKFLALGGKNVNRFAQTHYDESPEKVILGMLGKGGVTQKLAHAVEAVMSTGELPNNISEIMTRFAEYSRALAQGDDEAAALYKATEVTTNFLRVGHWGGQYGQTWARSAPYMPSSFNVLYKLGRQIREDPRRVAFVAAAAAMVTLGGALALLKFLDDDKYGEQRQEFMDAPVDDLQRFVYLPNPFGRHLFRWPVPGELGAVVGVVQLYAIQHYGGHKVSRDELFDTVAAPLPEQMQWQRPGRAAWSLVPKLVGPTLQAIANQQSFPNIRPIVPDRLKRAESYLQSTDYTTAVSKWIAYQLRDTPLAPSPMKLDFWIRAQFGPMGALVTTGKVPSVPLFDNDQDYRVAQRAFDRFSARKESLQWQFERLKAGEAGSYSEKEREEIVTSSTVYEKMADVLSNARKALALKPLPLELKQEVYQTLLFFDTSADIAKKADAIEKLNRALLKHAADSGAKIDHSKAVATPHGMEWITKEGIIDRNIDRRREIKLPPPQGVLRLEGQRESGNVEDRRPPDLTEEEASAGRSALLQADRNAVARFVEQRLTGAQAGEFARALRDGGEPDIVGAPDPGEMLRLFHLLAEEQRLRPRQFRAAVTADDYGERLGAAFR